MLDRYARTKNHYLSDYSNTFTTFAWYGHLKFKDFSWGKNNGGPFTLVQLKTIQEAIPLTVFMIFTLLFFKTEKLGWNHLAGFGVILLAVCVIFKNGS